MASTLAAVALAGLAGCEGEKGKAQVAADAGALDAGPPLPVVGGKLGAALAEAAAGGAEKKGPAAGGAAGGPPESGVFSASEAAAALPKDVPYKIEVVSDGSEPRARLAPKIDPKSEQKLDITLGLRMGGPQGLPNLELGVSFKAEKPADAPKEGAAARVASTASAAPTRVIAKITSAMLASMSIGGPPKQLADALARLKGSALRYELSPANAVSNLQFELSKDADPGLQPLIGALGEAITLLTPPLPDKPLGAGAYWMVTDRVVASGAQLPVLRYRVFKIEKVEGGVVSLSVDTRQYAEGADLKLPSPNGEITMTIDRLDSSGKGTLTWSPSSFAPGVADASQRLQALLVPPGATAQQAAQRSVAQVELTAKFAPPAAP
ncbi:hypothetical protein [Sorangium sp. So ce117]|uniref:hypothetical protein n=1 Tax=Sorangium sp. So ce117 TaxID=3133277 RepID=UPI003F6375B1